MSLTGLFLVVFLVVHLVGNLQLLAGDGGKSFNIYAEFMTTNPLIKTTSYLLYAFILLHAIQGWLLWRKNVAARGPQGYAVKVTRGAKGAHAKTAARMGWLGTIIFVFLVLHLYQFWLQMKLGAVDMATYDDREVADLYTLVSQTYANPVFVVIYVFSMAVVGYHLLHGFQSAFQTLGLNHKKYTPFIQGLGLLVSVGLALGFSAIPIIMFLSH